MVIAKAILEHVPKDGVLDFLQAIATAVRPGGVAIVDVPNMDWLFAGHERYMDFTHEVGFTQELLQQTVGAVFREVVVVPVDGTISYQRLFAGTVASRVHFRLQRIRVRAARTAVGTLIRWADPDGDQARSFSEPDCGGSPMSAADNVKRAARETWGSTPAGATLAPGTTPGSREFFERARHLRSSVEQPWLSSLVPFGRSKGRRVLELGSGAGFRRVRVLPQRRHLHGIDIAPENIDRARRHLELYGLPAEFLEADAEALPFKDASFDLVFSNGVLHHTASIEQSFAEAHRVVRPGGEFWVILYHRDSIFHWVTLFLYDHLLRGGFRRRSFAERLSMIEYTTSDALPTVNVYSVRQVRRLLEGAGFAPNGSWIRKLLHEDIPGGRRFRRLLPQQLLDRFARRWGWYVIARGIKPD